MERFRQDFIAIVLAALITLGLGAAVAAVGAAVFVLSMLLSCSPVAPTVATWDVEIWWDGWAKVDRTTLTTSDPGAATDMTVCICQPDSCEVCFAGPRDGDLWTGRVETNCCDGQYGGDFEARRER